MSNNINNGGPAFPTENARQTGPSSWHEEGMTLREYAAIKLRVPDSGTDWLDEMIRKSVRDELAGKAMQAYIGNHTLDVDMDDVALDSYQVADAMLNAREAT